MVTILDIPEALKNITVIVDTREQKTDKSSRRLKTIGFPIRRDKLDFGDYSAEVKIGDHVRSFANEFAIERKMSIGELCQCYCQQRKRFEREFNRAKAANAKIYLLIENGSVDMIYRHRYNSKMHPNALLASICALLARYNCQILFCDDTNSGFLIGEIIKKEIEKRLTDEALSEVEDDG